MTKVNNGTWVELDLPDFKGRTKVLHRHGLSYISYRTNRTGPVQSTIHILGERYRIVEVSDDTSLNPGFRTLAMRRED